MLAIFLALLSLSGLALSLKFSREVRSYLGAAANDTARPNLRSFAAEALQKKSYLGAILLLLSVCLIFKGFSFALWFLIGACAFLLGRALFCDDLEQAAQALCESVAKNEEFRTRRVIFINAAGAHLLFISAAGMLGALLYFYSSFPSLPALVSALSLGAALAAMYGITLFLPHSEGLSPVSTYQPFLFNLYLLSLAALVKVSSNLNLFLVAQRDWFILAGFVVLLFALAGVILAYRAY